MKDCGSWRIVCPRFMFWGAQVKAVVIWGINRHKSMNKSASIQLVLDLVWSGVGEWMRLDSVRYLEGATCSFSPNVWWNDAWKAATFSCSDRSWAMNNQNLSPRVRRRRRRVKLGLCASLLAPSSTTNWVSWIEEMANARAQNNLIQRLTQPEVPLYCHMMPFAKIGIEFWLWTNQNAFSISAKKGPQMWPKSTMTSKYNG